jgi:F-type H+-transporting ATPase subunit alpha
MQSESGQIVVYVLIGKRKADVEKLLRGLRQSGAIDHTIVVQADIFDSLTQSYLAPYAACSMAEALWYGENGKNCIVIYDDLSSHAEAYRQLSLLQEVDPGRDSYPGDIFYAHSSLLERGGKLLSNMKALTPLPVILTPNDDITAYLSTSVMSITDGQIIFDLSIFRTGKRPAVNAGLSVSRVGGNAQTKRRKRLSGTLFKSLAAYKQAEEFSHFSSQLSKETRVDLAIGKYINEVLLQQPEVLWTLEEQQLMMETVLLSAGEKELDIPKLKQLVKTVVKDAKEDADYDRLEAELLKQITIEAPAEKPEEKKEGDTETPATQGDKKPDGDKKEGGDNKDDKKEPAKQEPKPEAKAEDKPAEKPSEAEKKPEAVHA